MGFGRGPEYHSDGNNFDDWELGQAGFRADWDNGKADTFTLEGDLYKGQVGELKGIGYVSPPAQLNVRGTWDVSGGNLMLHWRHEFSDGSDLQVRTYYDRTYRLGVQLGESRNTFDADLIYHRRLGERNDFIGGVDVRLSPSDFIQVQPTVDFEPHHQNYDLYSTFLQDQISFVPNRVSLTLGSKFEHNIYTGWEVQPTARLLWTPTSQQTIWGAVTRAVRTPSRVDEDLQLTGAVPGPTPVFVTVLGSHDFVSEELLGYELGYRKLLTPKLYLDVSAFWNRYTGLESYGAASLAVVPSPPSIDVAVPYANGIDGRTAGFEIAPDWQPRSWLRLIASYSYLDFNLHDRPGYTDIGTVQTDEGSSPKNEATFEALANLPGGFEFDPTLRYFDDLPAIPVKAYTTMDVHIAKHIRQNVALSFVGQNLFQLFHYEFDGDPGPLIGIRRSYYGQITWDFKPH